MKCLATTLPYSSSTLISEIKNLTGLQHMLRRLNPSFAWVPWAFHVNVRDESFLLDLQDLARAPSAQSPVLHFPRIASQRVTSALKFLVLLWPEVACL